MANDPIARLLADAYVARHAPQRLAEPAETAEQWLARMLRYERAEALRRVLTDLRLGYEAREADVALLDADPRMRLQYLDARDEALALAGGELAWNHTPGGELSYDHVPGGRLGVHHGPGGKYHLPGGEPEGET